MVFATGHERSFLDAEPENSSGGADLTGFFSMKPLLPVVVKEVHRTEATVDLSRSLELRLLLAARRSLIAE